MVQGKGYVYLSQELRTLDSSLQGELGASERNQLESAKRRVDLLFGKLSYHHAP